MIQQLVFTSAREGLRPGSGGFTTVAATRDLSPPMVARLEALSAYQFAFPPADARADQNPVRYAHRALQVSGQSWQVLSRVAPTSADYTGRSNFIGHHALLERGDCVPAGPAWLLKNSDLFLKQWAGPPRHLAADYTFPRTDAQPAVCSAWQAATGDAGWGGLLVDALYQPRPKPAYIIYPAGLDVLSLINESLLLVPAQHRWAATFDTYFTDDQPDVRCLWRCVLAASAAAEQIRAGSPSLVIDLTKSLGQAADSRGARAARAGSLCPPPTAEKKPAPAAAVAPPPAAPASAKTARPPRAAANHREYDLADSAPPAPIVAQSIADEADAPQTAARGKRGSASVVMLAVGLTLLLALVIGGIVLAVTKPWEKLRFAGNLTSAAPAQNPPPTNDGDTESVDAPGPDRSFVAPENLVQSSDAKTPDPPAAIATDDASHDAPPAEPAESDDGAPPAAKNVGRVAIAGPEIVEPPAEVSPDSESVSAIAETAPESESESNDAAAQEPSPIVSPVAIGGKRAYHLPAGEKVRVEVRRDALILKKSSLTMPAGDRRSIDIRDEAGSLFIRDLTNLRPATIAKITIEGLSTHTAFKVVDGALPEHSVLIIPSSGEGEFVFHATPARETRVSVDPAAGSPIEKDLLQPNAAAAVATTGALWTTSAEGGGTTFRGSNFILESRPKGGGYRLRVAEDASGTIEEVFQIYDANAVALLRVMASATIVAPLPPADSADDAAKDNAPGENTSREGSELEETGSHAGGQDDAEG